MKISFIWSWAFFVMRNLVDVEHKSTVQAHNLCNVCLLAIVVRPVSALEPSRTRSSRTNKNQLFHVALTCCSCSFFVVWKSFGSLRLYGQVNKRTWWMPWQLEAMKDVVDCDKSRGAVKQALIREFPNGETHLIYQVSCTEYIGVRSERGELKHLSTRRKRNQLRFP